MPLVPQSTEITLLLKGHLGPLSQNGASAFWHSLAGQISEVLGHSNCRDVVVDEALCTRRRGMWVGRNEILLTRVRLLAGGR